jgi:hypothetical protein
MATAEIGLTPREREPFLAWPGLASFRLTLPLSYLFCKIFYSVYGGASLLAKLRRPLTDFYFPWEMRLPFLPSWSLVYLSVPLLMLATPFILRTWRSFTPFILTLTAETLIAGIFFIAIPLAQAYPPRLADGFFGGVFHLADRLNLDYNKFPSLHIAFAVTAAVVAGELGEAERIELTERLEALARVRRTFPSPSLSPASSAGNAPAPPRSAASL